MVDVRYYDDSEQPSAVDVAGDEHRVVVLETGRGRFSIHVVHSKRWHFADKMVLHLRSLNIDRKSSRFTNWTQRIEVIIYNDIMIHIPSIYPSNCSFLSVILLTIACFFVSNWEEVVKRSKHYLGYWNWKVLMNCNLYGFNSFTFITLEAQLAEYLLHTLVCGPALNHPTLSILDANSNRVPVMIWTPRLHLNSVF
jgi:hypothetical protein